MYGDNIRYHRRKQGMSQMELGQLLGVTAVSVSKWERSQTQPDINALRRMSELFSVTIDELCGGTVPVELDRQDNLYVMARAFRQMKPSEQEKMLAIGRVLFADAFADDNGEQNAKPESKDAK